MWLDTLADSLGAGLCVLGQGLRFWTWGSNAIIGKAGVRTRGPYTLMRHPLYAGNFLILLGLLVILNDPWGYCLFLLPFAGMYYVITNREEEQMLRRFGGDYQRYLLSDVPRFWPAFRNVQVALRATLPFGWRLAWSKEYESCCGWLAGIVVLEIYEGVLTRGWEENWPRTQGWLILLGIIGLATLSLRLRKSLSRR